MSSILRTIDSLKKVHVGDYVSFREGRLGYVEKIISPEYVRVIEDDGTNKSTRVRRFTVEQHKVALVPQAGNSFTNNRNLIQPPEPYENNSTNITEDFSNNTKLLISTLKESKNWTINSKNIKHPFLNYLEQNNHRDEGWIRNFLPKQGNNDSDHSGLNSKEKMIFITTYNLFQVSQKHMVF